jgi:hypothetical protein
MMPLRDSIRLCRPVEELLLAQERFGMEANLRGGDRDVDAGGIGSMRQEIRCWKG